MQFQEYKSVYNNIQQKENICNTHLLGFFSSKLNNEARIVYRNQIENPMFETASDFQATQLRNITEGKLNIPIRNLKKCYPEKQDILT